MDVLLAGRPVAVVLPTRFSERRLLLLAYQTAPRTVPPCAAIVAACVPELKVKAQLKRCAYDAAEYGMAAWDEMIERDIPEGDIARAAAKIYTPLAEGQWVTKSEAEEAEGFSSREGRSTDTPATSGASGDEPPKRSPPSPETS